MRVVSREKLQMKLSEDFGIETLIHYPVPPGRQKAYSLPQLRKFEVAEMLAEQVLSLPIGPHLNEEMADMALKGLIKSLENPAANI